MEWTASSLRFGLAFLLLGACLTAFAEAGNQDGKSPRSFATGRYRNLFREIGKSDRDIDRKLDAAWRQLFYGDDASQRVYYPVGADMAYIKDVGNGDVRSEGMSYGMMIAVQMGRREEFDRLWKWAKTHMQHQSGPWKGYFAWQCDDDGKPRTKSPASDGEEYFAMALYFAAGRWGAGKGIYDYRAEADAILHAMLHKERDNGGVVDDATNMFNLREKQVVFVPNPGASTFTDPSYHLPAFYELWSRWAKEDQAFWRDAAATSRRFFRRAVHPKTGLAPDYSTFDGKPLKAPWDPNSKADNFQFDAFRVGGNIAMDYAWFGADPWQVEQSNRMLEFFAAQRPRYVANYTVDGKPLVDFTSTGLVAMNAVAALASTSKVAPDFVRALWDAPIPSGQWRYYDGMLYMFGLLHASGRYRIWTPKHR
jgi:oligosaccharide reducing-end xylanase